MPVSLDANSKGREMKRGIAIGAGLVGLASLWAWCGQPGFTPTERLLIRKYESSKFSQEVWSAGDPKSRASMLGDLFRKHDFIGRKNGDVFALLGRSTCYADYEDVPCYVVEFGEGDRRSLAFSVNHSDDPGKVHSIGLGSY
jgi:hypothetical protein